MSTDEILASRILGEYGDNARVATLFFAEKSDRNYDLIVAPPANDAE